MREEAHGAQDAVETAELMGVQLAPAMVHYSTSAYRDAHQLRDRYLARLADDGHHTITEGGVRAVKFNVVSHAELCGQQDALDQRLDELDSFGGFLSNTATGC